MSFVNTNKILISGNLGHEPELRKTPKGNYVLSLSFATNRRIKRMSGEMETETHWHRATIWGRNAEEAAKVMRKGSRVHLEGELHMKSWVDKDGTLRRSAEIYVDSWRHLGYSQALQPVADTSLPKPTLALVR